MLQITNLHFNENDLLYLLVYLEEYISEIEDEEYKKKVKEKHDIFDKIWYELKDDEEYFIAEKPF